MNLELTNAKLFYQRIAKSFDIALSVVHALQDSALIVSIPLGDEEYAIYVRADRAGSLDEEMARAEKYWPHG